MDRVLIISSRPDTVSLVRENHPDLSDCVQVDALPKALEKHHQSPFDLIFADLEQFDTISEISRNRETIRSFKKNNPLVKLILIAPRNAIRETFHLIKAGADDYVTSPTSKHELQLALAACRDEVSHALELDYLRDHFWKAEWLDIVHSFNPGMRAVFEKIRAVAPTIATVLLLGETGTGKGLLARLTHWHSLRCDKPFIAVHCGAITETLIESELFGHEQGAFTGAIRKKLGKFEVARNGTIFLDEIGTIPPSLQIKLLQVLQDGTFSRVGGEETLQSDARIIFATNADLEKLVAEGHFRKDLYYRIKIFPIEISPLRERIEDLPHLTEAFLQKLQKRYNKPISGLHPSVTEAFRMYGWPGNVRELENVLERAYILERSNMLMPQNFPADMMPYEGFRVKNRSMADLSLAEARQLVIEDFEKRYIRDLLTRNKGRINISAKEARITPRQLNRLMNQYAIVKEHFKK
jgi:DNA-binding NtrC family response regulator